MTTDLTPAAWAYVYACVAVDAAENAPEGVDPDEVLAHLAGRASAEA